MTTFENEYDGYLKNIMINESNKKRNVRKWATDILRVNHKVGIDKEVKLKDFKGQYGRVNAELYLKNSGYWWTT